MNSVRQTSTWLISVTQNWVLNSFYTFKSKHLWFLYESQGMKSGIFMQCIIWYSLMVKQYIVIESFCGSWCRKTFWLDKSFFIKINFFFFRDETYISCHKSYFIVLKKRIRTKPLSSHFLYYYCCYFYLKPGFLHYWNVFTKLPSR